MSEPDEQAYLEPLRVRLNELEHEIQKHVKALGNLRGERTRLARGLAALDPRWGAEQRRMRKQKPGSTARRADGSYAIAEERVETVAAYIESHLTNGSFAASDIPLDEVGMSKATRSQALRVLHERGVLLLDRIGKTGGAKIYRTVPKQ